MRPSESDSLFLGIDGGGTKTEAVLARGDHHGYCVVGRGQAGCSNLLTGTPAAGLGELESAIAAAFAGAGLTQQSVQSACLALAGSDRAQVQQQIHLWARDHCLADSWQVVHDAAPLLAWTPVDQAAVAVISGTGSIVWGRNAQGQTERAGGWGPLLGDEGSGYWLVVEALRAVLREVDRGAPVGRLQAEFARALQIDAWRDLPAIVRGLQRSELAALSWIVLEGAEADDALADRLLNDAAQELTNQIMVVKSRLACDAGSYELIVAGGVLLSSASLRMRLLTKLSEQHGSPQAVRRIDDPAAGAVRIAWLNHGGIDGR